MSSVCPKCKGTKFSTGRNMYHLEAGWHEHVRCDNCKTVLWEHHTKGFTEHGYCGSPETHWVERLSVIDEIKAMANQPVPKRDDDDVPF